MEVTLIEHTRQADDILLFSKRTRYMNSIRDFNEVKKMSAEEREKEMDYVFNTISSSWEFIDYIFLIEGVTRAFTHQLVRHRVGTSFAQQTQRMAEMMDFDYMTPPDIKRVRMLSKIYRNTMTNINTGYVDLLDQGAMNQDARGVLPTNILTNILLKINLRALSGMMEMRLCVRTQGEFQNVAKEMRNEVLKIHQWAEPVLQPYCVMYGVCKFPRFDRCPIKKMNPRLNPMPQEEREKIINDFVRLGTYSPQPKPSTGKGVNHKKNSYREGSSAWHIHQVLLKSKNGITQNQILRELKKLIKQGATQSKNPKKRVQNTLYDLSAKKGVIRREGGYYYEK